MSPEVRRFLEAVPFVPFIIRTSDGREYPIRHPDFVTISPKGGRVLVFAEDELMAVLSTLHIVAVEHEGAKLA